MYHKYDTDVANNWPQNSLATYLKTHLTDVTQYIFCFWSIHVYYEV